MLDWTPVRQLLLPIAPFMGTEGDGMFMLLETWPFMLVLLAMVAPTVPLIEPPFTGKDKVRKRASSRELRTDLYEAPWPPALWVPTPPSC